MITCEHFLYGMGVPNYLQKTNGVSHLLTDKTRQVIINSTKDIKEETSFYIWFPTDNLIANIEAHPTHDSYGRSGVWIHVILTPIMDYFKHSNPLHLFRRYFLKSPVHEGLEPIEIEATQ